MNGRFTTIAPLLLVWLLLASIEGLANSQTPSTNARQQKPADKIAVQLSWAHSFQLAGFYAALHKGYYQAAGLDVRLVTKTEDSPKLTHFPPLNDNSGNNPTHWYGYSDSLIKRRFADNLPVVAIAAILQHSPDVTDSYGSMLYTSEYEAQNNPGRVVRFKEATIKGWDYAISHSHEVIQLILDRYNEKGLLGKNQLRFEADRSIKLIDATTYPLGSIDAKRLARDYQTHQSRGLANPNMTLDGFVFTPQKYQGSLVRTERERAFIRAHPVIRVGNSSDWPPFDFYKQGQAQGFSIDYFNLIAKKLGVEIEYVYELSWQVLLQNFKNKQIDVMPAIYRTNEREEYGLFSLPYAHGNRVVVTRQGERLFDTYNEMSGYTFAAVKGWSESEELPKSYPQINLLLVNSSLQMLQAVAGGKADVMILDDKTVKYLTTKHFIFNLKMTPFLDDSSSDSPGIHIATRDDWPIFNTLINRAIADVTLAESRQLSEKWYFTPSDAVSNNGQIRLRQAESDYLDKKGPLNVCIQGSWMPLVGISEQNQGQGFALDMVAELAKSLGSEINPVTFDERADLEMAVLNKRCDMLPLIQPTPFIQSNLDYTYAYGEYPYVIMTNSERPYINHVDEVKDKVLVALAANVDSLAFRQIFSRHLIHAVDTPLQGINQVIDGQAYGYVDVSPVIAHNIAKHSLFGVKINGRLDRNFQMRIATRNDEKILGAILSKAVDVLDRETLNEITNRWISVRYEHGQDYSLAWKILLLCLVAITGFVVWSKKLSQTHNKLAQSHNELKKLQRQLIMQEKMASLGTLTAGVAHEINNPTNFVHVSAQNMTVDLEKFQTFLLTLAGTDADEEVLDSFKDHFEPLFDQVATIQMGSERIKIIVQELRAFTRLDSVQLQDINIVECLRSTIHLVQAKYKEQVDFETHFHFDSLIHCQPSQLNQVFMNILVNACEAINMRDVSLQLDKGHITITTLRVEDSVKIVIADNGCGMDETTKERLFEPFYTTKGVGDGTGLGMSISFGIIKDHDGFISVMSQKDAGSQFIILLPLHSSKKCE